MERHIIFHVPNVGTFLAAVDDIIYEVVNFCVIPLRLPHSMCLLLRKLELF